MHVVATAGHVDHGKSTLVRALTGMEPDRWAEEHLRGMTIDLGYAWTTLPTGETVAFVDVPGHQRFIANMLAGVGPAPAVLFVVAADEGWSRQSGEHLRALDALGVSHGVLAITRSDLADPLVAQADSLSHLAGTSLGRMPAVAVSGVTGLGLDELRQQLGTLVTSLPEPVPTGRVRLWVDRSFTIRGAGTVVTGTLQAGSIAAGDELLLASAARPVRVRGLEVLGVPCTRVQAVARIAINVAGAAVSDIVRGDALLSPGHWRGASEIDVRFTSGTTAAELPRELLLHAGTAAVAVHVRPLGADTARLTLRRPVPLQNGDRAVLRDPGRRRVAGGVVVLDAAPPPMTRRGAAQARAQVLANVTGADAVGEVVRRGVVRRQLLVELGTGVPAAGPEVRSESDWLISAATWSAWSSALEVAVDAEHLQHPLSAGLPVDAARRAIGVPDRALLIAIASASDGVQIRDGLLARRDHSPRLPTSVEDLVAQLRRTPFEPPAPTQLAATGITPAVLAAAESAGVLVRLRDDVVLTPAAIRTATARLAALGRPFTLGDARDALGSSRRVALAVLEHLDKIGATARDASHHRTIR